MEARQVVLNDLQKMILSPVVTVIRRHRRDHPITAIQIRDFLNFWLDSMYPTNNPRDVVGKRDIEKVIQHCRNLPWPQTEMICSNGRGYYYPRTEEEIDPYISQLESRLKWIASNLRRAKRCRKELALKTTTDNPIQPDIFQGQIQILWEKFHGACVTSYPGPPSSARLGGGPKNQTGSQSPGESNTQENIP